MKKWQNILYPLISVALAVALWFIAAKAVGVEYLLPSPAQTFEKLVGLFSVAEFYKAIATTTLHAVISFVIAFIFACGAAILSSVSGVVKRILSPIIVIVRVAPTMSVIFLSVLWISSEKSPYLVCVFILFPMLYSRILSAISSVDGELLEMAKVYRVKRSVIITKLYLPHAGISLADECPGVLSFAVKLAVSGEAVVQSGISIGSFMNTSKAVFDTAEMIAYTVAAIVLGFVLEIFFKLINRLIIKTIKGVKARGKVMQNN